MQRDLKRAMTATLPWRANGPAIGYVRPAGLRASDARYSKKAEEAGAARIVELLKGLG